MSLARPRGPWPKARGSLRMMLPAVVAGLLGLLVLAAAPSADRTTTRYSEAVTSAASALPRPTRLRKALDAPVAARTPREPAAARPNPPPPTQTAVGSDGPAAPHRPHAAPEALRDPRALRALGPSLTIVVLLVLFFKPRGRPFRAGPPPPDARLWAPLRAHEGNPLPRPLALRRPLEKKRKPPFVEPTATMSPDLRLLEDEVQELEILPVTEEHGDTEAFVVEYTKTHSWPPLQRALKSVKSCEALRALPKRDSILRWVNVTGGSDNPLARPILKAYDVHPLFIEDILNDAERAKVEKLGDADLFILFQGVQLVEEDSGDAIPLLRLEMNQVSLVLSDGVLLSFFNAPTKAIEQCKANIAAPGSRLRTSSCLWLAHMIMDKEVDHLFPIMNKFRMQLEECQRVLEDRRPSGTGNPNASNVAILRVLQCTSQEMNNLVFVLRPLASAVMALTEYARYNGLTELQWYFDDLRDHVSTILDYVASMQTWARNLKDDYSYIQQDNMNRTMYVLTLITALFVPANFLTGLFGMNFEYMPWLNWEYGFWAFWGVIVCVNVVIVYLIKKLSWLQ